MWQAFRRALPIVSIVAVASIASADDLSGTDLRSLDGQRTVSRAAVVTEVKRLLGAMVPDEPS